MFRLLPTGFTNRDLRALTRPTPRPDPATVTAGQITYDLRRLRIHGLIDAIPHSHRYRVTDTGLQHAMFLTRVHDRLLPPGLAHLTDPDPPAPSPLRTAARTTPRPRSTHQAGRTRRMTTRLDSILPTSSASAR